MIDTSNVWESVAATPWWVYGLFLYLMNLCYLTTKARIIHIKNIFIMPGLLLSLTFISMFFILHPRLNDIYLWIGGLLSGIPAGWLHFRLLRIKAIAYENKLYIPGTWGMFVLVFSLLAIKHYYGYRIAFDLQAIKYGAYNTQLLFLYGLVTGLFIGRVRYALRCIKHGPYANISANNYNNIASTCAGTQEASASRL